MRLTLRTLLAYLDEILDPADADQLHRKIQDSEFATGLVHQIRGSVRRLRLDAPALDAQGIGGDVNTVAEYLDNTLPPEQVPALEKICLENEMHLGEVASCHQILTLVLGEAADVSDRMRERSYAVAPTVDRPTMPPLSTPHVEAHPAHPSPPSPVSAAIAAPRPPAPLSDSTDSSTLLDEDTIEPTAATVTGEAPAMPATEPSRRNKRSKRLRDAPSTKEAWRAESQQGLTEPAEAPPAVDPVPPAPIPTGRPAYSETQSSWVRPLLVTTVIGLLILLGLMFATRPLGDYRLLSGWFGQDRVAVVDNGPTGSLEPQSESIPPVTQPVEIIEVTDDTLSQSPVNDVTARTGFPQRPAQDPLADNGSQPNVDNERTVVEKPRTEPAETVMQLANEELFPLVDDEQSATPPDDVPPEVNPDEGLGSEVETTASVVSTERSDSVFGGGEPERNASDVPDAIKVNPTLPPKGTGGLPEVPPAPANAGLLSSRTENLSVPLVTSVAPLVDPGIDFESESTVTDLPEAFPLDNSVVGEEGATRLPERPSIPEPVVAPKLEPARLKTGQLLLAFDTHSEDWTPTDSSELLESGDALMCLPAFRTDVEIGSSLVCTAVGATRFQLGPDADVTLHDGQLLLKNQEADKVQGIRCQNERLVITMTEEAGVVAIEASRERVPGGDLTDLPHSILKVHAINQPITIAYLGQDYQLEEGQYLVALDNFSPRVETATKRLNWVSLRTNPDASAIRLWKRDLGAADNIRVWLRNRVENRQYNQRALAARCLAQLDEFEGIVAALNDPEQHSYWDQHFDTLKRAVTRGSGVLGKLQLEIEKVHGNGAPLVMEMIRGYTGRQLAEGAAAELVANLDHPRLDHRVLAFQNLKSITGFTQAFNPEKAVRYRREAVNAWKKRLKHGHVRYTQAPQVVALLESFATGE